MAWKRRDDTSEPLDRQRAYDAAIAILGLRPHLEAEIARKLSARGTPADVVDEVLESLRSGGLIDDEQVARRFAAETSTHRRWGAQRIQAELRRRGASTAVAAAAADELADPVELVQRAADRWARRRPGTTWNEVDVARLARHLSGLGHGAEAIGRLIRSLPRGGPEELEE